MLLTNYASAIDCWKGRVDSTEDYDAFRWHQWIKPLDLNKETERFDGELGFAFIGFCSELGVKRNKGRVGTALAPDYIRGQMSNLPCVFTQEVKLFDAGNILCDEISMEEGQKELGLAVEKILEMNLFPIVLGGGHETTFGHFSGQFADLKKNQSSLDMGIINFDAHFDMRPYDNGASSGSMFRQIADIYREEEADYHYFALGIQQHSNTVSLFKYAKAQGADYVLARNVRSENYPAIYEKMDAFMERCDSAYITVCTDIFSAAFAPGVSAAQALGVNPEVTLPIMKRILKTGKVRGFDICEISPRFDQDNATANMGAVIIFAVVNTLCKLKKLAFLPEDGIELA